MMPLVLSQLVNEFAKPITRPKWRQGGSFPSKLFFQGLYMIHDDNLYRYFIEIEEEVLPYTMYERAIELGGVGYF
jgi:hypothetical protein